MKWLHLSDIHMSQTVTGTDTRLLQKQLLDYLRQEVGTVDLLLLSGDYRYCGQPENPDKV